jgi:hypothetical protein
VVQDGFGGTQSVLNQSVRIAWASVPTQAAGRVGLLEHDRPDLHPRPRAIDAETDPARAQPLLRSCLLSLDVATDWKSTSVANKHDSDREAHHHQVHDEHANPLDPAAVDECLDRVASTFDSATVRSFVPLLVRRYVREELRANLTNA